MPTEQSIRLQSPPLPPPEIASHNQSHIMSLRAKPQRFPQRLPIPRSRTSTNSSVYTIPTPQFHPCFPSNPPLPSPPLPSPTLLSRLSYLSLPNLCLFSVCVSLGGCAFFPLISSFDRYRFPSFLSPHPFPSNPNPQPPPLLLTCNFARDEGGPLSSRYLFRPITSVAGPTESFPKACPGWKRLSST